MIYQNNLMEWNDIYQQCYFKKVRKFNNFDCLLISF